MSVLIDRLADNLAALTVDELIYLKKVLKEKYGLEETVVVAEATVAEIAKVEEKTEFKVLLTKISDETKNKLTAVKIVNRILNVGLKAAMDLTKDLPAVLNEKASKVEAEAIRAEFATFDAIVELQ